MVFFSQCYIDNIAKWCYCQYRKHQNGVKGGDKIENQRYEIRYCSGK